MLLPPAYSKSAIAAVSLMMKMFSLRCCGDDALHDCRRLMPPAPAAAATLSVAAPLCRFSMMPMRCHYFTRAALRFTCRDIFHFATMMPSYATVTELRRAISLARLYYAAIAYFFCISMLISRQPCCRHYAAYATL